MKKKTQPSLHSPREYILLAPILSTQGGHPAHPHPSLREYIATKASEDGGIAAVRLQVENSRLLTDKVGFLI